MPRSIWKGSISFGLVNVPVELYSAIQDKSVHFHMVTKDGSCRLRQKIYCPETNKEYNFNETAKGYEIAPDNYVIFDKKELEALKPETGKTIEITDFVKLSDIDSMYFERVYFLAPKEGGSKAYHLLLKSMEDSKKVAIAKFVMRQKEYLAVIRPIEGKILGLETMHYHNEIVDIDSIPGSNSSAKLSAKEIEIAEQLIDQMTTEFDPEQYKDDYSEKVLELIEQKAKGKEIVVQEPSAEPKTAKVIDLMDALKKSLEKKDKAERVSKRGKSERKSRKRSTPSGKRKQA